MWNFKSTGRVKTVDSQNPNVQGNVETYRSLTQAEYDELSYEEKHSGIVYFITDGATDHIAASSIRYDNSGTHIASTSVQGAIDALDAMLGAIGSIATIETSPATATHAVGDYILWNGQLYKVTAAIASGETLVIGTNVEAVTIGSELTALNNGLTSIKTLDDFIGYKDRTVSNISISSDNGYASLGNVYTDWGLPSGAYVLGFYVRGWSVSPGTFSLASSSDGRVLYVISTKAGTIGQLTIRVWYAKF